jgi:hypothetical protein
MTVSVLPSKLTCQVTRLRRKDVEILRMKQEALSDYTQSQVAAFIRGLVSTSDPEINTVLAQAAASTLVFAQEEAGTAVCIDPSGLILTCAHCVSETGDDEQLRTPKWLIFASGQVIKATCSAYDSKRDLALLRVVAASASANPGQQPPASTPVVLVPQRDESNNLLFPQARVDNSSPRMGQSLICIGHPGSEDLEASEAGIPTNYDVLHISEGSFRGLAKGQDPQDNSEIGALKHNCWTYWGHSGAPLLSRATGKLVGLHSSWDDRTGMRRGVPLEAIREFLLEHGVQVE